MNIDNMKSFKFGLIELFVYTIDGQLLINYTENAQNLAKNASDKILNQKYYQIFPEIVKNLIQLQNKKNNKIKRKIFYNNFNINGKNIINTININKTNLIIIGIFTEDTKISIINIFLLSVLISFINHFYKNYNFNIIENNNHKLNINIYKIFLFIPLKEHFIALAEKIFERHSLKLENIFYKNYYLLDLNSDTIIFSLQSLYNKNNVNNSGNTKQQIKINRNLKIWKEIIFHGHNLKNDYISQHSYLIDKDDYNKYCVKLQFRSTFPRRTFIIKFLPVLDGLILIHEYIQIKLSYLDFGDNTKYKEVDIAYGYNKFISDSKDCNYIPENFDKSEPNLLKDVRIFFLESFCTPVPKIELFNTKNYLEKNIYINEDIIEIISNCISNNFNLSNNDTIEKIISDLYEEFLQINNQQKNLYINQKKVDEDINSQLKNMYITKNFTLHTLFINDIYNLAQYLNINEVTINLSKTEDQDVVTRVKSEKLKNSIMKNIHIRINELLSEDNHPNYLNSYKQNNNDKSFSKCYKTNNYYNYYDSEENNKINDTQNINNYDLSTNKDNLFNLDYSTIQKIDLSQSDVCSSEKILISEERSFGTKEYKKYKKTIKKNTSHDDIKNIV